ncbi:hypothetical protein HMI54_000757 [Coelomomyces lativittatus]|nr:hypothetical protein HMI56_003522 [Coelomomyces lativittatus]KAJ1518143.1 hypothetical protein HMI55_002562 [Coelomomyces lativittatus]KAJ1518441.1 hypothetical protein HMI54_000757 [Coelomomyces lativittatus]
MSTLKPFVLVSTSSLSTLPTLSITASSPYLSLMSLLTSFLNERVLSIVQSVYLHLFMHYLPLLKRCASYWRSPTTRSRLTWLLQLWLLVFGCKKWLLPYFAQQLLNASHLRLLQLDMTHPTLTQLTLNMISKLSKTGPLATHIKLCTPIQTLYQQQLVGWAHVHQPISVPPHGGQVTMQAEMILKDPNYSLTSEFGEFAKSLVMSEHPVPFELLCSKGIEVSLLNGLLRIPGLTLHKQVELQGMQGLRTIKVVSVTLQSTTIRDMTLNCVCEITNPSNVYMALGQVNFSVYLMMTSDFSLPFVKKDTLFIGELQIPELTLSPLCTSTLHAHCTVLCPSPDTPNQDAVMTVLSNYLSFQATPVRVIGQPSVNAPYLTSAFQALSLPTLLPPLNIPMIQSTTIVVSETNVLARTAHAYLHLTNPFPVPFTLLRMHGTAVLSPTSVHDPTVVVGRLNNVHVVMYVPKHTSTKMKDPVTMDLEVGLIQLKSIALSNGILHVDLQVELDCRVGKCVVNGILYKQNNVPVHIQLF